MPALPPGQPVPTMAPRLACTSVLPLMCARMPTQTMLTLLTPAGTVHVAPLLVMTC